MQEKKTHKTSVGGQALIEGIMMQGPKGMATAVRKPDGDILTEYHEFHRLREKYKFLGWPLVRGAVNFFESMVIGYKTLMYSAEVSGMEEVEEEEMSKFERWLTDKLGDKLMKVLTGVASVLGFALAFLIFFYLPVLLFNVLNKHFDGTLTPAQGTIEGVTKIIIFCCVYCACQPNERHSPHFYVPRCRAQKHCLLRVRAGSDGGECEENDPLPPSVRHFVYFCNADFQRDFLFYLSQVFSGDRYSAGAVDAAEIGVFADFNGPWL